VSAAVRPTLRIAPTGDKGHDVCDGLKRCGREGPASDALGVAMLREADEVARALESCYPERAGAMIV
jgi:hypothetical protein